MHCLSHFISASTVTPKSFSSLTSYNFTPSMVTSAVTIIVVFIAIFQHYRIISLSRYFLCVRNNIFARHLRYASTIDSPPVYSSFSTLQSHAANDVTRVIAARRPWLSSVSVRERCRNCLWSNVSQVVSVARAVFMTSQLTITSVCLCSAFQVTYIVQFEWQIIRALAYVQAFFPRIKLKCVMKINQCCDLCKVRLLTGA